VPPKFISPADPAARCRLVTISTDFKAAAMSSTVALPYSSAAVLAQTNQARFRDDATAGELREELMRRLAVLSEAGVIDLTTLPAPKLGWRIADLGGQSDIIGNDFLSHPWRELCQLVPCSAICW
jgi:hypothetical protein